MPVDFQQSLSTLDHAVGTSRVRAGVGNDRAGSISRRLHDNPLCSRGDMQRAVRTLCRPVEDRLSAGGARVRLGGPPASYGRTRQEFEGFSRLLWGVGPLIAGGGRYPKQAVLCEGLVHGCDPRHPEYWGVPGDFDQRLVDCAGVAAALLLSPRVFWLTLSQTEQQQVATYLGWINQRRVRDNNWLFFRVLVNIALAVNGAPFSQSHLSDDLRRIDAFYQGDGWYTDGVQGMTDYYVSWGMHFYALLCARHLRAIDSLAAERLVSRAEEFAGQFIHWFATSGAAIPFGRSLTYRFAQAAFWGALAYGGSTPLPWGVIRGLVARHLRWWFERPICTESGLLSVGYGYPNTLMSEVYNSACSPYWALKAFLPLALDVNHPFWTAAEEDLPPLPELMPQPSAQMIICRHDRHVFALAAASGSPTQHRHSAEKYNKFCYSTQFAFSVPSAQRFLHSGAHDSMLALSAGDGYFRVRHASTDVRVLDRVLTSGWAPWSDVRVQTWLVAAVPWHVRVHCIESGRRLIAAEGGFAAALDDDEDEPESIGVSAEHGRGAAVVTRESVSVVIDLAGTRNGRVVAAAPHTNILRSRTAIPTLLSEHESGTFWLGCAVFGAARPTRVSDPYAIAPRLRWHARGFDVHTAQGELIFAHNA
jgi:hypothetical protein